MSADGTLRPSFDLSVPSPSAEVFAHVRRSLDRADFGCRGWVAPPYAELELQTATKRLWSPRLSIYAEDQPGGCSLHCRFQPEPNIWTLYMAAWGVSAVVGACGVAWYGANLIMGRSAVAPLLMTAAVVVVAVGLYLAARVGQKMSAPQMRLLRETLDTIVGPLLGPDA